jgi:hypothetical protein
MKLLQQEIIPSTLSIGLKLESQNIAQLCQSCYQSNFRDLKLKESKYTFSSFTRNIDQAISGTANGELIIWENRTLNNMTLKDRDTKSAIKFLKFL